MGRGNEDSLVASPRAYLYLLKARCNTSTSRSPTYALARYFSRLNNMVLVDILCKKLCCVCTMVHSVQCGGSLPNTLVNRGFNLRDIYTVSEKGNISGGIPPQVVVNCV